jgi:hypothetical protein
VYRIYVSEGISKLAGLSPDFWSLIKPTETVEEQVSGDEIAADIIKRLKGG